MRKADFEEIWETRFLLFCIPLLMETIAYYSEYERNYIGHYSKLRTVDIKAKIQFYNLYLKINNMLDLLCSFANNKLISNIQVN